MKYWAVKWRSECLKGKQEYIMWAFGYPLIFKTRREARAYVTQEYGYIAERPDLRARAARLEDAGRGPGRGAGGGNMTRTDESNGYPKNWREISRSIRERAGGRCECEGECGLHRTNPGPRRCIERNGESARWAKGKVVLTVAHLNHEPADCRPENLKAMCQRCHLRYDLDHHKKNSRRTRRRKLADRDMFESLTCPGQDRGQSVPARPPPVQRP